MEPKAIAFVYTTAEDHSDSVEITLDFSDGRVLELKDTPLLQEYSIFLTFLVFSAILTLIIVGVSYYFASQTEDISKLSSYECGFQPFEDSWNRFEIQFFLVAILFLVFDIEVMFLIPWCASISKLNLFTFWFMFEFLIELGLGFFYVWYSGALDW